MKYTKPTLVTYETIKVITVIRKSIPVGFIETMDMYTGGPDYTDNDADLEEHLYGENTLEEFQEYIGLSNHKSKEKYLKIIKWLWEQMNKEQAAYVRFVKM